MERIPDMEKPLKLSFDFKHGLFATQEDNSKSTVQALDIWVDYQIIREGVALQHGRYRDSKFANGMLEFMGCKLDLILVQQKNKSASLTARLTEM